MGCINAWMKPWPPPMAGPQPSAKKMRWPRCSLSITRARRQAETYQDKGSKGEPRNACRPSAAARACQRHFTAFTRGEEPLACALIAFSESPSDPAWLENALAGQARRQREASPSAGLIIASRLAPQEKPAKPKTTREPPLRGYSTRRQSALTPFRSAARQSKGLKPWRKSISLKT